MESRKKNLITAFLLAVFIFSISNMINVKANEKNIINLILSENGESSPALFDIDDGYLYPGAVINKDFILKNTTSKKYTIKNIGLKNFKIIDINGKILDFDNNSDIELIEEFYSSIVCTVSCNGFLNDKILYADDLKELIEGKTLQSDLSILSGDEKKFSVVLSMKTSAGNNMQGIQANFNIVFNAISINGGTVVDPPINPPVVPPVPVDPPVVPPLVPPVVPPVDPIEDQTKPTNPPVENSDIPKNTDGTDTENPSTNINVPEDSSAAIADKELFQTGSPIDTLSLSIMGLIFIGTGAAITFKKKKQ